MACEGATGRTCTGLAITNVCTVALPVTNNLVNLSQIVFSPAVDQIRINWDNSVIYSGVLARFHIRKRGKVGYEPWMVRVVDRNAGTILFDENIEEGEEYLIWWRVEDSDEANDWFHVEVPAEDLPPYSYGTVQFYGDIVMHNDDVVVHFTT